MLVSEAPSSRCETDPVIDNLAEHFSINAPNPFERETPLFMKLLANLSIYIPMEIPPYMAPFP